MSDTPDLESEGYKSVYFLQKYGEYRFLEHISTGSYGIVFKMYHAVSREVRAVKCTTDPSQIEIDVWKYLDHQNIIPLMDMYKMGSSIVFVMPFLRTDLWTICSSKSFYKDKRSYDLCRRWFKDLLHGVFYLHRKGLSHLDLRLDNAFLKDNGKVCVGDFSLMSKMDEVDTSNPFLEHFQPPEFTPFFEEKIGRTPTLDLWRGDYADMWEIGIFVIDMLMDRKIVLEKNSSYEVWKFDVYPFIEKIIEDENYLKHSLRNKFTSRSFNDGEVSDCHDFLKALLQILPVNRMTADAALRHNFVTVGWPMMRRPQGGSPVLVRTKDRLAGETPKKAPGCGWFIRRVKK